MARPVSVFIAGTLVVIKTNSLQAESRMEERGTASFTVIDTAGSGTYSQNMTVAVYDGEIASPSGTPIYAGFIESVKASVIGVTDGLLHQISCKDNHYLADKRLVAKSYTGQTLAYIVNDIITSYLAAEGITAGTIQTGPTVASAIFNYVPVTECFDALKELSGFTWCINHDKTLDFLERATNAAPWALTASLVIAGSAGRVGGNSAYRNRQYVRGGTGTTEQQTENFTGDAVTKAFAVGYPLASAPTVTVGGAGKTVGIKGIDTGKDCYWNKGDAVVTFDTAPAGAAAIVIVYNGQYPLMVKAESFAAITAQLALEGGTGIVETIVNESRHESSTSITDSASGKVRQYCQDAAKFTFRTRTSGLEAGQMLTVTYSPFDYTAAQMLIESVSIQEDSNQLSYAVTAITGPVLGSWTKLFARILERQDNAIKLGDSLLLILLQQQETLDLTEAVAIYNDDFNTTGMVNRWLNAAPINAGSLHNVQHERLKLTETPTITDDPSQGYAWG